MVSFLLCVVIMLRLAVSSAYADESSLAAAPAIIEAVATPSEPVVKEIQITNTSFFPLPIKGQASAFLSTEQFPEGATEKYNAANWITIEPADFILQPKSAQNVKITITAPQNAEPGGHYATIYFSPLIPREAVSPEAARGLARIGVLTFLIVPGSLNQHLEQPTIKTPRFVTFGPITIDYTITNSGNIHILPAGNLVVEKTGVNETREYIAITPKIILPGTDYNSSIEWGNKMLIGHYRLAMEIQDPNNPDQKITSRVMDMYAFPWPVALGLILVLTLFYNLFIVNRKRLKLAWRVLRGHQPTTGE